MLGQTLSRYRVIARLGAGGMGEVYRATDEKLARDVAIKVLPGDLAHDAERLARFEREAQLLASLNHPNIAAVHGLEEADGKPFLVLELVEGEDLSDRLRGGPLPVRDALEIGAQIAEALAEAHERGIVHRDLKPANVKVTPDGQVKVLDFGLAKALTPETGDASSPDRSQSPTLTAQATAAGIILGTAAYMSPEQARGRPVDQRADIWALGVVLFEMLTGRQLFDGETVSDVLAAVLKTEVDWRALPADVPPGLRRLLRRCLERDPRRRLHSAADARLEIEDILEGGGEEGPATPTAAAGRVAHRRPWLIVALLGATLLGVVARHLMLPEAREATSLLTVQLSADEPLTSLFGANALLSPDGRTIAFVTGSANDSRLHVRRMDEPLGHALPGTDGARSPFFSPDGRWIGFSSRDGLMKVGVDGGPPVRLADLDGPQGRGAAWTENRIVFAPGFETGLSTVPAEGGAVEPLTELDLTRDERSHRWPWFLPGGHAVLFMVQQAGEDYDDADIEAVTIADGRRHPLVLGGAYPRFLAPDTLLFVRGCVLYAQHLDPQALTVSGPPMPVLEDLATWTGDQETGDGSAEYSVSSGGDLLYRTAGECAASRGGQLVWVDRDGQERPAFEVPFRANSLEVSPDGKRVLLQGRSSRGRGVFIHDLERGGLIPLTTEGGGEHDAIWSPDGRRVAYAPRGSGQERGIAIRTLDEAGSARVIPSIVRSSAPTSWTKDGRALLVSDFSVEMATDLWLLPLGGGEPRQVVATPREDDGGRISPDGRWVAYYSEERGDGHVFVTALDASGPRWQVSVESAAQPRWSRDGRFLYFVGTGVDGIGDQDQESPLLEVAVEDAGSGLRFGEPRTVYRGFLSVASLPIYDTHPDGRLLLIKRESQDVGIDRSHAVLVLGWREQLRRRLEGATR